MDKPTNFTVIALALAGIFILPIFTFIDWVKGKNIKQKELTLKQKLYQSIVLQTPNQSGGLDSQDRA